MKHTPKGSISSVVVVRQYTWLCMSAHCWNCNKELVQYAETMLIDMAICDVIDSIIAKFQKDFNRDKKPNFIRVVK